MSTNQFLLVLFLCSAAYVTTTQATNNSSDSNDSSSTNGTVTVASEATFNYNYGSVDLSATGSADYIALKTKFEAALKEKIVASMGASCTGIEITEMSAGSLIIKFNILIDSTANPDYANSANAAMGSVANSGISVDGVTMAALNVKVDGQTPDSSSSKMMVSMVAVGACVLATALTCN